jgi:hypothetical protein
MGGRMSGESQREEKVAVRKVRAGAARPYQTKDGGDTVRATAARQASRQQLVVCTPLGQHDLCDVAD